MATASRIAGGRGWLRCRTGSLREVPSAGPPLLPSPRSVTASDSLVGQQNLARCGTRVQLLGGSPASLATCRPGRRSESRPAPSTLGYPANQGAQGCPGQQTPSVVSDAIPA